MIPGEINRLWVDYLATERIRVRQQSLQALESFIGALVQLPAEVWHPWARQLAQHVVDDNDDIPIRLPLFRSVIFPALVTGLNSSSSGCARWLAGLAQLLYKSPSCQDQLPENQRSEFGLLLRAVQDDPNDTRAKKRLLSLMRSRFDYALHELPAGVLYGHDGATIEQCDELLVELSDYERLAMEFGAEEEDRELIAQSRFHIPAYRRYLLEGGRDANYETFLSTHERH